MSARGMFPRCLVAVSPDAIRRGLQFPCGDRRVPPHAPRTALAAGPDRGAGRRPFRGSARDSRVPLHVGVHDTRPEQIGPRVTVEQPLDRDEGSRALSPSSPVGTPRRVFWWAFCVLSAAMVLWSLANPPMASPDEPAHVVKAAA